MPGTGPRKGPINIQDGFLFGALKEEHQVAVALTTGKFFKGRVLRFDRYAVVFETPDNRMLVYKHAIVSIIDDLPDEARQQTRRPVRRPPSGAPRRAITQWQR